MQTIETPNYYAFPGVKNPPTIHESEDEKMERIITTIARYLRIDPVAAITRKRKFDLVYFRHLCMFFIRQKTQLSLKSIGYRFAGKDHTTVLHACNTITGFLSIKDDRVTTDFEHLKKIL